MSTMKSTGKAVVGAAVLAALAQTAAAASTTAKETVDLGLGRTAVAVSGDNRVYVLDSLGQAAVLAGNGRAGFGGDDGPAGEAMLYAPSALAVDGGGNLYIADTGNHRIRRVDAASGIITTVAGNGRPGFGGDGSSATEARLRCPGGVAADGDGNLFIADTGNHRVRRVDALNGQIVTIAGNGRIGRAQDGDLATDSPLRWPTGLVLDAATGRILIAETGNHRVVGLEADGTIRFVAGDGVPGFSGDGGQAVDARLHSPSGVSVDSQANVQVNDTGNSRVRRVDANGWINTIAKTVAVSRLVKITVSGPNKREEWAVGSSHVIRWSHRLAKNTKFNLELSRDGGLTWQTLSKKGADTEGNGSFAWVVTGPNTPTALIRVRSGSTADAGLTHAFGIWYTD